MDRPLGDGLFGYWLPVAHATLLGVLDVAGNVVENAQAAVAAAGRRQRRRRARPPPRPPARPDDRGQPQAAAAAIGGGAAAAAGAGGAAAAADEDDDPPQTTEDEDDDPRRGGAPVVPLGGHVAIVTGGSAGIGLTTARKLAERGATVILAARDAGRTASAARLLRAAARRPLPGCPPGSVEGARLDLSSLDSVRAFARAFNASGRPLSLLVLNAGVMAPSQRLSTPDGLELQLQTNAIGHWLLAHELLAHQRRARARGPGAGGGGAAAGAAGAGGGAGAAGAGAGGGVGGGRGLAAGAAAAAGAGHQAGGAAAGGSGLCVAPPGRGTRVVVVSSLTHVAGAVQWADKQSLRRRYDPFVSYALSKLAGVVVALELQRRFDARRRPCPPFLPPARGGLPLPPGPPPPASLPWYDGCPGAPACGGCAACRLAVGGEYYGEGGGSSSSSSKGGSGGGSKGGGVWAKARAPPPPPPPAVLFARDTAVSLHPGIVATGLATGFFDRAAAAIVPGGGAARGDGAAATTATAVAAAPSADAAEAAAPEAPSAAPAPGAPPPPPPSSSPPAPSSPLSPLLARLYPWLLRSPEAAGDGVLRACLAADADAAGAYWHNGRPSRASGFARDPGRGAELWDYAVALCAAETDESLRY